jgi:hypothetical protein
MGIGQERGLFGWFGGMETVVGRNDLGINYSFGYPRP